MTRSLFRRRPVTSLAAVALIALLLTATVAELVARTLLNDRLAAAVGRALGKDSDIDINGGPALLALFDRRLDAVTVSSDDATFGRIHDVSVQALDDIRLTGDRSGTIAHTHAEVEVPAASLQGLAATSGGRLPVTAVHLDGEADTVTLVLGQGGLGQATLKPRLEDGRLTLDVEDVEVLGSPGPRGVLDRIQGGLSERTGADYPLGLKATALDVTDTGLGITLDGEPASLPARSDSP